MFLLWFFASNCFLFFSHVAEIAQLTSFDSGIAETPDTDDSVSVSGFDVNCEIVT